MFRIFFSILLLTAVLSRGVEAAAPVVDENAAIEAAMKRLRDTLRNTMTQLQTAQAEVATLQAEKAEAENTITEQKAKIDSLTKQLAADQASAKQAASEADTKLASRGQELARTSEALEKWKAGYKQAAQVANATEAKRAQLSNKAVMLERTVTEQRTRNAELYKLGTEILKRYEKFGLGSALLAREPFTGIAKVKFQTLIQDYQDNLNDQTIKPDAAKTASTKPVEEKPAAAAADATAPGAKPASEPPAKAAPAPAPAPSLAPMPDKGKAATPAKAKS